MVSKRMGAVLLAAALLSGCATPVFTMKNAETGQVAKCGGGVGGSMAGGLIGYKIQKKADQACVKDYESRGFTPTQK